MAGSNVVICVLALVRLHLVLSDECRQFNTVFGNNPIQLGYMTTESDELLSNTGNFTICFWMKPTFQNDEWTIFSYESFPSRKYGNELTVGFENINGKSKLIVGGSVTKLPLPEIFLNVWKHVCVLYDGSHPKVTFIYNGDEKFEKPGKASMINYEIPGKGKVVVGQDQDTYGGRFQSRQSMKGELSRLQMWNRLLNDAEVKEQMQCNAPEGNLISWTKTPWQFRNGAMKDVPASCRSMPPACRGEGSSDDIILINPDFQSEEKDDEGQHKSSVDGTSISQGCGCVTSSMKKFQNLIQTYKDELFHQKQAIDALGQRVSSLEESLRSERSSMIAVINKTLLTGVQEKIVCPPVFTLIHDHCYYFSPTVMNNWSEASKLCQKLDPRAKLANIETATEWDFLKTYLRKEISMYNTHWWIGGSDHAHKGHWRWMGSNQPLAFSAWCPGQPDNDFLGENCLRIWGGSNPLCWNDLQCANNAFGFQINFICEI